MKKLVLVVVTAFATSAIAADPPAAKGDAAQPGSKGAADKAPAAAPAKPDAAKPADKAAAKAEPAKAEPAAPAAPPPAPEIAKNLKGMEGKWKCEGTVPDSPMGKGYKTKASFEMKSDLNGYFEVARYEEKKTKENAHPYVMQQAITFDPGKSELVRTDMDSNGGITHMTSKGWDGDKMVWEGEVMGPKTKFKETETKKGDKEVDIAVEVAGADGNLAPAGDIVCKK